VGDVEEVDEDLTEETEETEERGLVVVVVGVVGVVVGVREEMELTEIRELLLPETVEGVTPELVPEEDVGQSVVEPAFTVKAADCEVAPVVSRSNNPILVPAAISTTQVNEVPVRLSQEMRAAP